jgi:bifunctional non-homologous end joining protein LigD
MLPMPAAEPFDSREYAFDVSWDGVRALASIDQGRVRLWGRDLSDMTARYPEVHALTELAPDGTIVDGELIATDADGGPDALAMQARQHAPAGQTLQNLIAAHPVTYVVYDLLYLKGRSMMKEPLARRRARMYESIRSAGRIYVMEPVASDGLALFDAARDKGLEGVIAKRLESPYRPGQQHPDWLQIDMVRRQDFAVMGFLPSAGNRLLEALIVGTYDGRSFQACGRVVGGFDKQMSVQLRKSLDALPAVLPPGDGRWSDDQLCWVKPTLVVNVKFSEWDQSGQLRFPIFNALKSGIAAEECFRAPVIQPPDLGVVPRVDIQLPRLPI